MTAFEHALFGATATLAAGLHRRYGWPIAAMAGVAAVAPDWDGLALLFGPMAYDRVHRAWGHNVFAACLVGAAIGAAEYRWRVSVRVRQWLAARVRMPDWPDVKDRSRGDVAVWMTVGALAALSHLAADLVVSGADTLGDWSLKLLWPFSEQAWVYPLIRWGDPGLSVILFGGVFAMLRWPDRLQTVAWITLVLLAAYLSKGFW
ncbi:MAG: metal-dependent hydrolase [Thermoguttaceae bacterium]|jgi:membrane-bound metal-dependent hydrolase YbcI (DUF457 family)|nr:metal-dependent hydrolase [Thermoguttaceae bacterium]